MKRIILALVLLPIAFSLSAQKKQGASTQNTPQRCATDVYLQQLLSQDPGLKARLDAAETRLSRGMDQLLLQRKQQGNHRLNAVVTIPVVVHIILPNPSIVTDADVQWQINKLNIDYAGQNADSVNAGPFAASFGHSQIQFCLAQRDPKGNPTTGIERITSGITYTQNTFNNLKHASNCGADAWDPSKYLNVWVAVSTDGTLGAATFPTTGIFEEQGVVLALESFGNNPAYVSPNFNLGRTAVHEMGHLFFARHIWGDGGGCAPDFPNVGGLTGTWVDDTPTQSGPTSGCPSGTQAAGCSSPNPPGKMYQNYMDYTNDACYCMFTNNQVLRMEAALEIFRNSLTTSDGCMAPVVFPNDAAITAIISPNGGNGCTAANNAICNPNLAPMITLKNFGSANLTSATIHVQIDNGTPSNSNWTGNLAQNASIDITLPVVMTIPGNHTLKIYITAPNGSADGRVTNDTLTSTFSVLTPVTAPLFEGFESTTFPPPTGWHIVNADADTTWVRTTAAARSGIASARIPFFDYPEDGQVDYLLSPPINVLANDTLVLSFDRAYRLFSTDPDFADTLAVVISFDCGTTFTEVWKRGGSELASVGGTTDNEFIPTASQWANARINLQPYITSSGNLIIGFKAVNSYGNNLYLDNINIDTTSSVITDAQITEMSVPARHECRRTFAPEVTIRNNGNDTLTKATIVFMLDNVVVDSINWTGFLRPGHLLNIEGDDINIPAGTNHTLKSYTRRPNDMFDMDPVNDTARKNFVVHDVQPVPVQEGFENTSFPPTNWVIDSSQSGYTWERTTRAAASGIASAWIRNYRFGSNGKNDDLYSPLLQAEKFDSVVVRFDMAHAAVGGISDTLKVLLTKDCGQTFEEIFSKAGNDLGTTGIPGPSFPPGDTVGFVPTASQWRSEYIDITSRVTTSSQFMIVFRNKSNNGNNTFLDNININAVILPERLKQNGFIVTPNPFNSTFTIRHLEVPTDLKAVIVTNAAGQIVYRRQFNGNAGYYTNVNLGGYSSGMYHVKMIYNNRVANSKLIKL